jgi:hypothetical protein
MDHGHVIYVERAFFLWNAEALEKLKLVISHPEAFHSDNALATDNAVSALGKMCEFQRDAIDAAQVLLF